MRCATTRFHTVQVSSSPGRGGDWKSRRFRRMLEGTELGPLDEADEGNNVFVFDAHG